MTETLLTIREAAERLGTSDKNLRNWIDRGKAKAVRVGPTERLRIARTEVDRLAVLMEPRPAAS